jgi:stage IV sporulation protein FB
MGGLASYRATGRTHRSEILIALAGPTAGFLLAAFILAMILAAGHEVEFDWQSLPGIPVRFEFFPSRRLNLLIFYFLNVNIFWGLVNLLPVAPLDGSQVAREVLDQQFPGDGLRRSLILSFWVAAATAVYAILGMHEAYIAMMFAYLAYNSYAMLQAWSQRGGFGS